MHRSYQPLHNGLSVRFLAFLLLALIPLACGAASDNRAPNLSIYPHVPGLAPSPRYRFRVRELSANTWHEPFAFYTYSKDGGKGYYSGFISGWSHTYCNFEMQPGTPIEIEITRLDGSTETPIPIETAVAHPRRRVQSWRVENGKAYIIIDQPMQFAVDIDGQFDTNVAPLAEHDQWAFPFRNENALHGVTVFANPFIDKPNLDDPDVLAVEPGTIPPDDGEWKTLYFKPGVHQLWEGDWELGDDFRLRSNRHYYIPGDAVVHGNMNNRDVREDGKNIRIYGHGTLSGARITHASHMNPPLADADRWRTRGIRIRGAVNCQIEGITLVDMPDHNALLANGTYFTQSNDFNYIRWTKVIGWRANSDGLSPSGSGFVEDSFIRTQDDGSYIGGLGIRRMVYWTDAGGCPLRTSFATYTRTPDQFPPSLPQTLYIEDIDVIYARSAWSCTLTNNPMIGAEGGATSKPGNTGAHIVFRNIYFTDPLPMRKFIAWSTKTGNQRGDIAGVTFKNIRVTAPTVFGFREVFYGRENAQFRDIVFDNVTMAGKRYTSLDDFEHNEFVSDFIFTNTGPFTLTYQGESAYNKWYIPEDWDKGFEPADNDMVNHTEIPGELIVDAPAWAGSLAIAHTETAIVTIQYSGELAISDQLAIGTDQRGRGVLHLADGVLRLRKDNTNALLAENGGIHIAKGTLKWKGDQVAAIQKLYASGNISIGKGQADYSLEDTSIIGRNGPHTLHAYYDSITEYTMARVHSPE